MEKNLALEKIPTLAEANSVAHFLRMYSEALKKSFSSQKVKEWAESLGFKSRITYKNVMSELRPIYPDELHLISDVMDMSETERVKIQNGSAAAPVFADKYYVCENFFKTPVHTIILNLCGISEIFDEQKILQVLAGAFSPTEIVDSIRLLLELKLIELGSEGSLKRIFEGSITTYPGIKTPSAKDYFAKCNELSEMAMHFPLNQREMHSFSFRLRGADLPKLKDVVRNFREQLSKLSPVSERDSVFQCTISCFPLFLREEKSAD